MSNLDKRYTLKLDTKSTFFNPTPQFSLSDNETSDMLIRVTNNNKLIDMKGIIVVMVAIDPNGIMHSDFVELQRAEEGLLYCNLNQSLKNVDGTWKARLMCIYREERIVTSTFSYKVNTDEFVQLNQDVMTDDRFGTLTQMLSRLSTIELLETNRQEAENSRVVSENNRLEEFEVIKEDYNTYKNVMISESNVAALQKNINDNSTQIKDMAKDVLLEDGKLYLKKSDGTKLGIGVVLPVSGSGGNVTWESLTGKPTTFTPSSHSHSKSDITDFPTIPTKTSELNNDSGFLTSHQDLSNYVQKETGKGLSTNDLTTTLKQNYDNAYTHSQSTHAPANAQKNSDITKEEIEAKLTGEISTHSHANGSSIKNEWVTLINKKISVESVNSILENFILDGNYNYFKIYITRTSDSNNTVTSLSLKQIIVNGISCGTFTIGFGNPQTERKEIFVSVHKLNNLIDWSYRVATNSLEYNQSNMTYGLSRMGINSSYLNKLYVAFNDVYTGDINIIVEGGII